MNLSNRLSEFVRTNALIKSDERLLLAVSGGVDSMVMASIVRDLGWKFCMAHCNFQLRGIESDEDEQLVSEVAEAWKVPFYYQRFDTMQHASDTGQSIQMAARELRYKWFEQIRMSEGYDLIATGHNLNDAIETSLFNFTRGAGLTGLAAIAPGQGRIIRPLLFATRQEIQAHAIENEVIWREDRSNATDDYARNYIRHHVIRQLETLNPGFLQTAGRNLNRLRATDANFRYMLDQEFGSSPRQIEKKRIALFPAPFQILRALLRPYGFTEEQCRQMAENIRQTGPEWFSHAGYRVLSDRNAFIITQGAQPKPFRIRIDAGDLMISLPDGGRLFLTPASPEDIFTGDPNAVIVDLETLRFPLTVRAWEPGDAFQPLGMGGKRQKLQDFFTNRKLSRLDKEHTQVLENGDGAIIWVVGFRLDERFKVTEHSKNAFKISRVATH